MVVVGSGRYGPNVRLPGREVKETWPTFKQTEALSLLGLLTVHFLPFLLGIPGETAQTPSQAADVGRAFLERMRRSCTSGLWAKL